MHARSVRHLFLGLVLMLSLILVIGGNGALIVRSAPPGFVTSNGFTLQIPQQVPVFRLTALAVNEDQTSQLAQRFGNIYARQPVAAETYLSNPRYTVPNTQTLSLLTQYGATGGFYAFNLEEVGRETPVGKLDPGQLQGRACQFLLNGGFMAGDGQLLIDRQIPQNVQTITNPQFCDLNENTPFGTIKTIEAATLPANALQQDEPITETIGAVIEIPMGIPYAIDRQSPQFLPIGGPGGHLSLLFSTTDVDAQGNWLDPNSPGLAAVAMPFFGRQPQMLERTFPIRDPRAVRDEVEQLVRATYPDATNVTIPDPALLYFVRDAAVEQEIMEPVLDFGAIEVTVDGETIVLRNITVPLIEGGAQGLGATVQITEPANDSRFRPGTAVTFRGTIADGAAPYTYQWFLDDNEPLSDPAVREAAGEVTLLTDQLPVQGRDGLPAGSTVILRVTDSLGIVREATVFVAPEVIPAVYLPLVVRGGAATSSVAPAASLAQVGYTFGVEGNWDYPPYGPGGSDLPGVIPDVNGFRNGMTSYGYASRFFWSNGSAWERDWRDCGIGNGIDCTFGVDRAAFVYYAGHGGAGGLSMASSKDSTWFDGSNARYQNLRWVGFASCQTLRVQGYSAGNEPIRRWFNAFRGAHMLLGFNSNMSDIAFGGRFVDNMRMPSFFGIDFPWAQQTIAQAWVNTAFQMNAGKPAYIYARSASANPNNDKLPRPGQPMPPRPFPVQSYHWVWWNF
ncbi:DUF6345 domain-containing protein [Candidatus Chloroploca sp. Khr17]|uniref:DUF6345 domain-containing protein n=1 Tax=Candidatus Chloroploca sp. Khr17 TaxID=2496869 RepID=UPI00101D8296|nr:DUF6345 domain-containing protein [Candidatus Chloroploca sp. Khr17]